MITSSELHQMTLREEFARIIDEAIEAWHPSRPDPAVIYRAADEIAEVFKRELRREQEEWSLEARR